MSTPESAPQSRLQRRGLKGLLLFSLLFFPLSAHAALKSWSTAVDGSWSDPAKWSPAGVPAATDSVRIAAAGAYTVILQGSVIVAQLSVGGNGGNPTLWVQGSSARGNAALRVNGGAANAGLIRLESSGGTTISNLTLPSATLVNQGTIEINAGTGGQRQLSANLDNQGTFRVNAAALFNKVGGVYTNRGEFRIETGQSLSISGSNQVFNQNGGTLVVDGDLALTNLTFNFNDGSIPNQAPLLLTSTLNIGAGATGAASFRIRGRSTLNGNIAAGQTVWANGTTRTDAVLTWSSGQANAGTLRLESSDGVAASNVVLPSGTLVNTGLIEVRKGSGGGRSLIANLENRGTFTASGLTRLTQTSNGVFNNSGAITFSPTDTLNLAVGTFTNQPGGTLAGGGLLLIDRITLTGAGAIGANVEAFESTISPGSPVGVIHIDGAYYQDPFSEVDIDLGGAEPGTGYDRLEVTGEAYLDGGALSLGLLNGYQPGNCEQFTVLSYGTRQRTFEDIDDGDVDLDGDLQLSSAYTSGGLNLLVSDADTRINIVPTQLNLAEGGPSQSYRVCLGRRPDAQVRVLASPDAQVRVAPTELIFAEAAWNGVQSVAVTAVDDAVAEGTHNGIVTHSASSQDDDFDEVQVSRVVAQIADNEQGSSLSVGDVLVVEGNSGTRQAVFAVTLSPASGQTVTVAYATANGTATAGSDYTATNGSLSFAAGETTKTVPITINGDVTTEPDETFTLNLSNPGNATIADGQGVGTITNDDATPTIAVNDVSTTEGNSGTKTLTFAVTLSNPSSQAIAVAYATANGTASGAAITATVLGDYVTTSGNLSFAAGETSKTVAVTINGDVLNEANETFTLNLSNPANATISDAQGVGTITNDDAPPTIAINDVSVPEGNSGTSAITFTVILSNASAQTITVAYATANGTATAGSDYTAASSTLTFNAGETSKTIAVSITGDALSEDDETFNLNLSSATNATIADAQGVGTITNDDTNPTVSINDASVSEGNSGTKTLSFTVTLSTALGRASNVTYTTANGTATAGSDYVADSRNLVFTPGVTSQTVAITINGDLLNEANETFTVNLSSPTNVTIADGQGLGTITNDDATPSISINDVSVNEGNSGTSNFTFTATLSAASSQTVTVAYATANGTATSGSDYTAANSTLTIAAGQISATMAIPVTGDLTTEPNETFTLNLSNPANATIADGQGVGTITNDDATPTIAVNDVSTTEGNSGTKTLSFTVSLSNPRSSPITVQYATANGTATAGSDYTAAATTTLTFAAGETSKSVAVTLRGDVLNEPNETFTLNLSNPSNAAIGDAQGIGTITNDDAQPSLSVNDVSVVEGNNSFQTMTFTVTLSAASGQTVTVTYATANGTATAGVGANGDYNAASGTLTYTPGQTTKTVGVNVRGDGTPEANETFFLNLSNPGNATLSDAQGIGTIINNDGPAKVVAEGLVGEGEFGVANYPNPFNPSTQIIYTLTEEAPVRLAVYNTLGQGIRVLVEGLQAPGSYEVQWDGRNEEGQQVSGGWYLYRLEAGAQIAVGRMSLVK